LNISARPTDFDRSVAPTTAMERGEKKDSMAGAGTEVGFEGSIPEIVVRRVILYHVT
jgi:hypothetical protein